MIDASARSLGLISGMIVELYYYSRGIEYYREIVYRKSHIPRVDYTCIINKFTSLISWRGMRMLDYC